MNYLKRSKTLDQYQTGFRKFHNAQSALLKLTDDIGVGKDWELATLLLHFAFSKAFDTISPSKLLSKLRNLGFFRSALRWLTLLWEAQVTRVPKRVNKALYGLRFIKPCKTQSLRKRLVESLVISHLYYCSVTYHDPSDPSFTLRKRLQRRANKGIR